MLIETTPPPLTHSMSDALMDALSKWTHIDYDDREDAA